MVQNASKRGIMIIFIIDELPEAAWVGCSDW